MELFQKIGLVIDIPILIAGVAFFTVFLLFMGFRQSALRRTRKRKLIQKIQRIEAPLQADDLSSSNPSEADRLQAVLEIPGRCGKTGRIGEIQGVLRNPIDVSEGGTSQ